MRKPFQTTSQAPILFISHALKSARGMPLDFLLINQYLLYILGTALGYLAGSTKIVLVDSIMEGFHPRPKMPWICSNWQVQLKPYKMQLGSFQHFWGYPNHLVYTYREVSSANSASLNSTFENGMHNPLKPMPPTFKKVIIASAKNRNKRGAKR